ncbi:hypothetical protein ABN034_03890 [Actinopolymorpha sp. B11F2]|uniref:hypothetical protein n=1 Tax=Actinopolymorpha sp. B11F2 TaxID=3160862 RepID=UPI0032E519B2
MPPTVDLAAGTAGAAPPARQVPGRRPGASLWTLRGVALVHAAAVVGQPLLAGRYLGGDVESLAVHGFNGSLLPLLTMLQGAAALAYVWPGGGRGWPFLVTFLLFFAEGIQIGLGHTRELAIHLPLGVGIVVVQVLLTVWLFRGGARRPRRPRRRQRVRQAGDSHGR